MAELDRSTRALKMLNNVKYQVNDMETRVNQLMANIRSTEEVSLYVERSLPLQVHFQLC